MTELKLQQSRLDNRYDLKECLGRGSYAEIYVARDIAVEENHPHAIVVIKALNILLQGVSDEELDRTLIENFQNEAIALDRVRHPNIINRLGHGTAIDLLGTTFHYMVIEYLAGGDLAARCRKHPLQLNEALFYLEQVCMGLAHAHQCKVIHRDIKPQNLLLTTDEQTVKIADFGVAKLEATEGAITRVGTNVYAPPEHNPLLHTGQLEAITSSLAHHHLTPAADIYSLAKTTYSLLAGEPPRRFSHRQITELPHSIAHQSWAPSILEVLKRATHDKPYERYQTVQEFWEELSEAALPPTKVFTQGAEAVLGEGISGQLTAVAAKPVPAAPPRARFDSAGNIERFRASPNGGAHPRIVVPLGMQQAALTAAGPIVPNQPAREILGAMSDRPAVRTLPPPKPRDWTSGRGMRFLVAALLVIAFAGILLATHNYFRGRINLWGSTPTNTSPAGPNSPRNDIGREVLTTTDVYLRPDPGTSNSPVGKAETGSRVRILNASNNWYEVQILEHGRTPDADNLNAERGWVNKRFLKLDS